MKKLKSKVEFTFKYDGQISVDLSSKGTIVSDEVAEAAIKRFPFVSVEEVEDIKKEAEKEVKKAEKETKKEEVKEEKKAKKNK